MTTPETTSTSSSSARTLGIVSIVMGVLAFVLMPIVFGAIGIVCGAIAANKGERLGKIGLFVSLAGVVLWIALGALLSSSS
jgi:hypothetical protein